MMLIELPVSLTSSGVLEAVTVMVSNGSSSISAWVFAARQSPSRAIEKYFKINPPHSHPSDWYIGSAEQEDVRTSARRGVYSSGVLAGLRAYELMAGIKFLRLPVV